MHLYWRINHDLNTMGESIIFKDPRFMRCFHEWVKKNKASLILIEELTIDGIVEKSISMN